MTEKGCRNVHSIKGREYQCENDLSCCRADVASGLRQRDGSYHLAVMTSEAGE